MLLYSCICTPTEYLYSTSNSVAGTEVSLVVSVSVMPKHSSPKRPPRKRPYAVYKGQELERHAKPDVCRKQLEEAFCRKIRTLPPGEMGLLIVLPADKRGPPRIFHHNLTKRQAVAAIKALSDSLPDQNAQERLDSWVETAQSSKGQEPSKRSQKRREFLLYLLSDLLASTATIHATNSD